MTKFNYKKWITDSKVAGSYGYSYQLSEQMGNDTSGLPNNYFTNGILGSYYKCSPCPNGQPNCTPLIPAVTDNSIEGEINWNNISGMVDLGFLSTSEFNGPFPSDAYILVSASFVQNYQTSELTTNYQGTNIFCTSGSGDTGTPTPDPVPDPNFTSSQDDILIDYTNTEDYFDNPIAFCADNPFEEYDVFWFVTQTNMCAQCQNDPIQNAAIQCCCCPGYDGLPQQAIDYYAESNITFTAWGGPNQCDGTTITSSIIPNVPDDPLAEILTWTCNPGTTNILNMYEVNTYLGPSEGYVPELCDVQYLYNNLTWDESFELEAVYNIWQGDDGTDGCCVNEDWEYWPETTSSIETGSINIDNEITSSFATGSATASGQPAPQGLPTLPTMGSKPSKDKPKPKPKGLTSLDFMDKLTKSKERRLKERFKYIIRQEIKKNK